MDQAGGMSAYRECMTRSYGSLEHPNWGFVSETVARDPYRSLLTELERELPVEDDTDINDDVCFTYLVRARRYLSVKLSMVGPYALMLGVGNDADGLSQVIADSVDCADDTEHKVLELITRHGFIVLSARQLEQRVPITFGGKGGFTVYEGFFSQEDLLPWRPAGSSRDSESDK
jgi:hypothetical protein